VPRLPPTPYQRPAGTASQRSECECPRGIGCAIRRRPPLPPSPCWGSASSQTATAAPSGTSVGGQPSQMTSGPRPSHRRRVPTRTCVRWSSRTPSRLPPAPQPVSPEGQLPAASARAGRQVSPHAPPGRQSSVARCTAVAADPTPLVSLPAAMPPSHHRRHHPSHSRRPETIRHRRPTRRAPQPPRRAGLRAPFHPEHGRNLIGAKSLAAPGQS